MAGLNIQGLYLDNTTTASASAGVFAGHWRVFSADGGIFGVDSDGVSAKLNNYDDLVAYTNSVSASLQTVISSLSAASGIIGAAEDATYEDGLFADFIPTTPVGTAVDRFNEVLKALAPTSAPGLSHISFTQSGVAGKLSFGTSNTIATYTNVPTVDINGAITVGQVITDGSDSVTLRGIFNASTTVSGVLADTVATGPGSPTPPYPANAFGDADTGSVQLWVNDSQVASVTLTTSGALTDGAFLSVSASTSTKSPNGTDFPTFTYRTGTWSVAAAAQRNGYNRVEVRRVTGSTVVSNVYGWIVDADATATTYSSESLSSLSMAGSKKISGVEYNTSGSATYAVTIANLHRNSFSSSGTALTHTATRCTVPSLAVANIVTNQTESQTLSQTATVSTGSRILNQGLDANTTTDRTVQADVVSTGATAFAILLDATAASSTSTTENFDDETYRVASNLDTTVIAGYNGSGASPSDWDSSISLASATAGYSDGLLVENGTLKYPTQGTNGGNFAGIANGPAGNVNYFGVTGNRTLLRFFYDSASRQNFILNVSATGTTFGSTASGNQVKLEIMAPNTTTDGSTLGVWKDASVSYTKDNAVGCYASAFGSTIPTSWGMTLGGKSTATAGNVIVVRITAASGWTGSINSITLTWL